MENELYDSILIGAGLTGLTIAHYLRKAGLRVLLLEKNSAPGGVIQSHAENGFIYESGPNTGVISSVELVRLFKDLKLSFEVPQQFANARWIWRKNRWEPMPSGLISAVATPLFTLKDKFRILGELFRAKGTNPDETLAELVIRRMGKSFLEYAIDPFISGIYAGDPAQLVTRYAMPKLYALEQNYGSFIKGSIAKSRLPKTAEEKQVTKQVFSVKGGLSVLTDALVHSAGYENIVYNCSKLTINQGSDDTYTLEVVRKANEVTTTNTLSLRSRSVITTVGGPLLPAMLPFLTPAETESLTSLRYAKVIQVAAGYTDWKGIPIKAFGGLVPTVEQKDILGILFPSALFENRAPENGALLSVFMGGIKRPELYEYSDRQLTEIAVNHINEMMQTEQKPDLLHIFRYPYAIPQYDAGSGKRLHTINDLQFRYPGLMLAGNIRDGIGMSDRVKQGAVVAKEVIEYLNIKKFL